MAAESKPNVAKFETRGTANQKKLFTRHCKKLGVSQSERIRDLIQRDLKENRVR